MANTSTYSMKNVVATLDGTRVTGLWDGDDAISVAPGADIGTGMVGADGSSIFSQSTDDSATITLRLQHTSPTHQLLMRKLKTQKAGRVVGFPFSVLDKDSGEGGATDKAFIYQAPSDSKGTNATQREWTLWVGSWSAEIPDN